LHIIQAKMRLLFVHTPSITGQGFIHGYKPLMASTWINWNSGPKKLNGITLPKNRTTRSKCHL